MKKFTTKKEIKEAKKLRKQTDKLDHDWDQDELYKDFEKKYGNEQRQKNRNNKA